MGAQINYFSFKDSGQRDSNARHQPWQGCALPLSYARTKIILIKIYMISYKYYNLLAPLVTVLHLVIENE